ncbi:MAG: hypothetical protein PHW04_04710 [Candidatus Wallbacteria bacterium]|nr:hypothetical protein [Candidatus Wallbacteria bacterium]
MGKKIFTFIISAYFFSLFVFAPYYNWVYIRESGIIKWFFLGEIVATVKAFAWPYFVLTDNSTANQNNQTELIKFNADEGAKIQDFLSHTDVEILSEDALIKFRSIMQSATKRLGRYFSKVEAADFIEELELNANYRIEFGAIVLASWDRKQYFTTQRFNQLYEKMKEYYPQGITDDLALLKAASAQQAFIITDVDGNKIFSQPWGREQLLLANKKSKILKVNTDNLVQIVREFTR